MGYIKEPTRIDFVVDPKPLSDGDMKMIHEAIAHYKETGKKKAMVSKKRVVKSRRIS